jgi:hypothetical protein
MFKRIVFSFLLFLAVIFSIIGLLPKTSYAAATIQSYPMPSIYTASSVFSLKADNTSVPVISYMQDYDYAEFSFSGTVSIEVTASENITSYSISPKAKNIAGTVNGNKLTFTLSSSTYVIVNINSLKKLVIAADPLETDIPASSGAGIYNVTSAPYNADSTGISMATTAIQNAIDDANQAGGGTVYVPAGVYTSGNLTLKSNVTFYLAGGAVIVGTGKGEDYAIDFRKDSLNADGTYFIRTAVDSSNITLRGRGTIDGKGMAMRYRKMPAPNKNEGFVNNLLVPIATSNFTFDGLILRDGGFWSFMVVRSDNVTIKNLKGFQDLYHLEDDVIDINESQNVLVKHAVAISDDDNYSTKTWLQTGMSSGWPGALEHLENVVFDDALAWTRCAAFKVGMGVAQPQIGVTFQNSYVYQSARALLIDHGYQYNTLPVEGYAQNITFDNIDIEQVGINQFGNYWLGVSTSTSGDVSNVILKNINVRDLGSQQSRFSGNATKGGMVNGVTISDVYVKGKLASNLNDLNAVTNSNVKDIIFANSKPPLFSDNFEDGDSAGWTSSSGSWSVVTDNTYALATKATATSLITAGDNSWTDYIYEAKMELPITNANAGIVFRVKDSNNYYMYRINSSAKKLELYKAVDGTLTSLSSTSFTAVANQWYTVKAVIQGNHIQGYVDGILQTDWTNPVTELTSGKIGFRTTSAGVLYDDVLVTVINNAPTDISLTNDSVAENTTAGGSVGTFSSTDPDAGDTFTYTLVAGDGDTDNGSFTLSGNTLILGVTPDYEVKNSYSIRVRSIDSGGLYVEKNFTIHITDVSEPPANPNPGAILFSDNFEDGDSAGWTTASGSWSIVTDNTKALAQKATATSLITAGDNSWTDYIYEAKMKLSITNANAGMIFRVKDSNNYYMYRINSSVKKLELYKAVDGTLTSLSSTSFTAVANQWYTVKAVIQGNHIQGYVDGVLQTDWTNPVTELTAGKIGFRTTSAGVLFDDVVVSDIDKTAPVTMDNAPTNWVNDDVTVMLTATDSGSGVDTTYYTVDSGTQQTGTTVIITSEGTHTLTYWSIDKAGNTEEKHTATVQIDKTAPTISGAATSPPNANGWYNNNVTVHFTSADSGSGVASSTQDTTLSAEGANQSVQGTATDNAGNSATTTVGGINIDKTAPTTTANAPATWVNKDVTVTLTASDSGSGVDATYYTVDGGDQRTGTAVTITAEGTHTVTYWSVDKAGNTEAKHSATVRLDKTAPTVKVTVDKDMLWPLNHQLVSVTASVYADDSLSGIDSVVLTSITSSEADNGLGDGDTPNDIQGADFGTFDTNFMLRAERAGNGPGRVYTITYTVTDKAGNKTKASATVTAPHDQSGKKK